MCRWSYIIYNTLIYNIHVYGITVSYNINNVILIILAVLSPRNSPFDRNPLNLLCNSMYLVLILLGFSSELQCLSRDTFWQKHVPR